MTTNNRFRFEVEYKGSNVCIDDDLFIVGSEAVLGSWKVEAAKKMHWTRSHIWTCSDLFLPSEFQYKYFARNKKGEIAWEQCENRIVRLSENETYRAGKVTEPTIEVRLEDSWAKAPHNHVDISRKKWWKEAVVYQIYPRSFLDSNGDGIGDLRGVISKLDYLKDVGVDVIWLSPVYKSPNDDNGYDISDYEQISEEFGTLSDWEELLNEMHKRGMKMVMDLVVNHTSDEHRWFTESRKSKDNPYRDYYIWKPPHSVTGKEPNNWASFFGGSVWQLDEATGEYYLHLFSKKQPDLNWENPKLREEIWKMMEFWLRKGIDGFRMDVINVISKSPNYPDAMEKVEGLYHWGGDFFVNGPRLMEFLGEMKAKVLTKYDILTVGETPFFGVEDACRLTNENRGVVNMLFHFELMDVDTRPGRDKWHVQQWKLGDIKDIMSGWQIELQGRGWNSLYLENHDQPRSVSRFGDSENFHKESAKMLATWLHMMQGTIYIYQGQEIGMTNVKFESIDQYRDLETKNAYRDLVTNTHIFSEKEMMDAIHKKSRDNARTPMQWNGGSNAGFTSGTPWIHLNPNHVMINVEKQQKDPDSILNYYKRLVVIRKKYPIVVYGSFVPLSEDHTEIYAYLRTFYHHKMIVVANFSANTPVFEYAPTWQFSSSRLLISNYDVNESESFSKFKLRPYEARVYLIESTV